MILQQYYSYDLISFFVMTSELNQLYCDITRTSRQPPKAA
uniref:Uncharacterized protein n=1 Tax=Microplitis mediator bracovirus TaxID=1836595 RepID=A0A2I6SGU2_9VIRU|nr:hypothetical protein MmBV_CMP4 [Microplitis mediator bracovirus]